MTKTHTTLAGLEVTIVDGPRARFTGGHYISRFMLCPHGALVPLVGQDRPLNATKLRRFCDDCERQRDEGRAQDERIKTLVKSMPRRKRGKRATVTTLPIDRDERIAA